MDPAKMENFMNGPLLKWVSWVSSGKGGEIDGSRLSWSTYSRPDAVKAGREWTPRTGIMTGHTKKFAIMSSMSASEIPLPRFFDLSWAFYSRIACSFFSAANATRVPGRATLLRPHVGSVPPQRAPVIVSPSLNEQKCRGATSGLFSSCNFGKVHFSEIFSKSPECQSGTKLGRRNHD